MTTKNEDDRLVTVCAACKMACCWQGIFYCEEYKEADIEELPIRELKKLGREHPDYWKEGV